MDPTELDKPKKTRTVPANTDMLQYVSKQYNNILTIALWTLDEKEHTSAMCMATRHEANTKDMRRKRHANEETWNVGTSKRWVTSLQLDQS